MDLNAKNKPGEPPESLERKTTQALGVTSATEKTEATPMPSVTRETG